VTDARRQDAFEPIDRMLSEFFRSERPSVWPTLPATRVRNPAGRSRIRQARLVVLAALILASLGVLLLGEAPGGWPAASSLRNRGTLEAKRNAASKAPGVLPGKSLPAELPAKP
jgi:hypothetical protein